MTSLILVILAIYLPTKFSTPPFGNEINPDMKARSYYNIQVMVNLYEANKTTLCIYCEDQEFSSLEHGNDLFEAVAQHVLDGRASGQTYPIYITDID